MDHFTLYRSPLASVGGLAVSSVGQQQVFSPIENRKLPGYAGVLVESGEGRLQTAQVGVVDIKAPTFFWLFPSRTHSYGPPVAGWGGRWVLFDGSLVRDFLRLRLISERNPVVSLIDLAAVQRLFASLRIELADDTAIGHSSAAATLHRLVVEIARQAMMSSSAEKQKDIQTVLAALRNNACASLSLVTFAAQAGMSPATLRRKVVDATGMSPKRISCASGLIEQRSF